MSNNVIKVGALDNANTEVTVDSLGEAFITQRKAAELLGVSQSAIRVDHHSRDLDVNQGLTSDSFDLALTYYALFNN